MSRHDKKPKPLRPPVGPDRPCQRCGQPIYYNYRGPIDGVCGRCADRTLARQRPRRAPRRLPLIRRRFGS